MKRFLTLTALLVAFCACDSGNTVTTPSGTNRMSFNDQTLELQSAFSLSETDFDYGRLWGITLYAQNFQSIPWAERHTSAYVILPQDLLGREIDLTKPLECETPFYEIGFCIDGKEYELYNDGDECELWFGEEEVHDSVLITSGRLKVAFGDDAVSVVLDLVFSDGTRMSAVWDGPFIGKSPATGPETGPVYGTMNSGSLSSELRSAAYAVYSNPDAQTRAFLVLSPESSLEVIDGELDADPRTILLAEIPSSVLGKQIDLREPLSVNGEYSDALIFFRIDRCGLVLRSGTDGWIVMDEIEEEDPSRTVAEGTFLMEETSGGTAFTLDARLTDDTRLTARWEGPVMDLSGFSGFDYSQSSRLSAAARNTRAGRANR